MNTKKIKSTLSIILLLIFIGCSSSSPKNHEISTMKKELSSIKEYELGTKDYSSHTYKYFEKDITDRKISIPNKEGNDLVKVVYNEEKFNALLPEGADLGEVNLSVGLDAILVFKNDASLSPMNFKLLTNESSIYFVDDKDSNYVINFVNHDIYSNRNDFTNRGDIYIIGKNKGSEVKINGNFNTMYSHNNLYLGVYVNEDRSGITTDRFLIEGKAGGEASARITFLYDENINKLSKNKEFLTKDPVISAKSVDIGKEQFILGSDAIGLRVGELEYKNEKESDTGNHEWRLKIKK